MSANLGYCDNTLVEGDKGNRNSGSEGHVEYKCKLTGNLCVARSLLVTADGPTHFLEYDSEIAERCPFSVFGGKPRAEIMSERKAARREEIGGQISELHKELSALD